MAGAEIVDLFRFCRKFYLLFFCFDLAQIAAFLDFTHKAKSKVRPFYLLHKMSS